jgi:hypothetical protein
MEEHDFSQKFTRKTITARHAKFSNFWPVPRKKSEADRTHPKVREWNTSCRGFGRLYCSAQVENWLAVDGQNL